MSSNSWQRIHANAASRSWTGGASGSSRAIPRAKRILDIALSAAALVALAPILLLFAIGVRIDSPGPILHSSRRFGRNGRVFRCFKFRTMSSAGHVTAFGSFLRTYGLDELPQFLNVLRGDMSIVGPRPVMAGDTDAPYLVRMPRFEMNPGLTGLWAVQDLEFDPFAAYVSPDDTYRRNWSLWLDMKIILRSMAAALAGNGS